MLQSYHLAWLRAHPDRDEAWLEARLADGFQVHHLNCNHWDDRPENLCLIDGLDHMRLHAFDFWEPVKEKKARRSARAEDRIREGLAFYRRREAGEGWKAMGAEGNVSDAVAMTYAKMAAGHHGLPWPVPQKPKPVLDATEMLTLGRECYRLRAAGLSYEKISREVLDGKLTRHGVSLAEMAAFYAAREGLAWPVAPDVRQRRVRHADSRQPAPAFKAAGGTHGQ